MSVLGVPTLRLPDLNDGPLGARRAHHTRPHPRRNDGDIHSPESVALRVYRARARQRRQRTTRVAGATICPRGAIPPSSKWSPRKRSSSRWCPAGLRTNPRACAARAARRDSEGARISSRRALSRRRSLRSDSGLGAPASHPSRLSDGRPSRGGDDDDARPQSAASRARRAVVDTIDTAPSQIFLFLILILALFLTDVVALVSAPDVVNEPVGWTMFAVLIVFAAEFFLNCACRDKYLLSFFFWMDLLGTFSIVADVPWLSEGWLPDGAEIGTTLRVSRAAKIGAGSRKIGRGWRGRLTPSPYSACFGSCAQGPGTRT